MFSHRRFGEVEDDIFYTEQVLREDLSYAQAMIDQPITDYEKERWQAQVSQFSSMLTDVGIPNSDYSQVMGYEPSILTAGFNLTSNWPILAILGVGFFMMFKKGPNSNNKHRHRRKRSKKRR